MLKLEVNMKLIWPLKKSWQDISQPFGVVWSANPTKKHSGVDIAVPPGNSVFVCMAGIVAKTGLLSDKINWARYVVVEHDTKDYCTTYLDIDPKVNLGDKVGAGSIVGVTAKIDSPHLHFGVWRGINDKVLTPRGALPFDGYVKLGGDPAFPSNFIDPLDTSLFEYNYVQDETSFSQSALSVFTRDLSKGCIGEDVRRLQQLLNKNPDTQIAPSGVGSPGKETDSFGELTKLAVQNFQLKHGIASPGTPGYGTVGPKTKKKLQEIFG